MLFRGDDDVIALRSLDLIGDPGYVLEKLERGITCKTRYEYITLA